MTLQVTCECGWTTHDEREALIAAVRDHCVRHHGRAAPTNEEILAVARPTRGSAAPEAGTALGGTRSPADEDPKR
jgi:hypothetical protein